MDKDNKTLEKIAKILLKVDKDELSDKKAIEKIMKIVVDNSTDKLKEFLDKSLKERK